MTVKCCHKCSAILGTGVKVHLKKGYKKRGKRSQDSIATYYMNVTILAVCDIECNAYIMASNRSSTVSG